MEPKPMYNRMQQDYLKLYPNATGFPWLDEDDEIIPEAEMTWAGKLYPDYMNMHGNWKNPKPMYNRMQQDYLKLYPNATGFPWLDEDDEVIPDAEMTWVEKIYPMEHMNMHGKQSGEWMKPAVIIIGNIVALALIGVAVIFMKKRIRRRRSLRKLMAGSSKWSGTTRSSGLQ